MGSVVAQLPALIGVLIGTVGTIVATSVADRARWKRNQSVRWDDRRLDAYVEFARVIKEIHAVAVRMLADERPHSRGHRMNREEGLAQLADADVRRTLTWESLLLLGDAATVSAARDWRDAVWEIERVARGLRQGDDPAGMLQRANEARDLFYRAARGGLGVRGGSVAQAKALEPRLDEIRASLASARTPETSTQGSS
ncbi:hypothetical protein GA0070606_0906 [Micromonospora citrea]|uniref:Secreted protein n=1 Tax=Micromonospora citrea TaxID=47855 RepID=A0A1C6TWJ0_9ACTN|nr:hypothetical protein [Micromonospora citrea]SCL46023.1 hypothetical protein GA0070606_0906 [Micromonospora citrea]